MISHRAGASGGDPAAQEFVGWWEKEREQPLVQAAADAIQTFLTGASAKLASECGTRVGGALPAGNGPPIGRDCVACHMHCGASRSPCLASRLLHIVQLVPFPAAAASLALPTPAALDGVQDVLRLADFRRRAAFKFNNGLFEFSLTMPVRTRLPGMLLDTLPTFCTKGRSLQILTYGGARQHGLPCRPKPWPAGRGRPALNRQLCAPRRTTELPEPMISAGHPRRRGGHSTGHEGRRLCGPRGARFPGRAARRAHRPAPRRPVQGALRPQGPGGLHGRGSGAARARGAGQVPAALCKLPVGARGLKRPVDCTGGPLHLLVSDPAGCTSAAGFMALLPAPPLPIFNAPLAHSLHSCTLQLQDS